MAGWNLIDQERNAFTILAPDSWLLDSAVCKTAPPTRRFFKPPAKEVFKISFVSPIYNLILLCVKSFLGRAFNLLRPALRLLRPAVPVSISSFSNGMRGLGVPAYQSFF